ncbi:FAD/NAD(P)-binding protein [Acidothermus cellulolyticus]|uniref:FAD/NAD(P)-binding protein n=1 Tax=Acidothermus cellulolyticus TaxID=28049 RepID=UPI0002D39426|nr:FAD/NAD(P)-binding protein [Acidothermus cellulolyticus]
MLTFDEPTVPRVWTPQPFRVAERRPETADTVTLRLQPLDASGMTIEPGQFLMVYLLGIGEVPISVSGIDDDGTLSITVRAVGAVSRAICASTPGSVLGLRGPCGTAWPIVEARGRHVLVVAGGIGLAPLRPLIRAVLDAGGAHTGLTVLYGARTPADLLYRDELTRWAEAARVAVTVDRADSSWRGQVGVVPKLIATADVDPAATRVYMCGPEIMMRLSAEALIARGLSSDAIYVSMERHMECGVGWCGHCQLGPTLVCRDGPVYPYSRLAPLMEVREL